MGFRKILTSNTDKFFGQIGGGAWLNTIEQWPTDPDTGDLMLPVMMLTENALNIQYLPEGMALTVFVSIQRSKDSFKRSSLRNITINQKSEFDVLKKGYSKVLLHKRSSEEIFPETAKDLINKKYIDLQEFDDSDDAEEAEDDINGASISKVLGRPHWLQDLIPETPRYYFLAQITDYDIRTISPQHEGIFGNGMGYIFADNRAKKLDDGADGGYFFIQFT